MTNRSYDMTIRNIKKQIRDLRRSLEMKQRERREGRSRAVRRREARLARLPRDMRCPVCGNVKLRSRQWVVMGDGPPICRACWQKV